MTKDYEVVYSVTPQERATQVLAPEERKPVLYDSKDRPLYRRVGFKP